jgi:hypothetical protein
MKSLVNPGMKSLVTPAQAGVHILPKIWIPAFAGMTGKGRLLVTTGQGWRVS